MRFFLLQDKYTFQYNIDFLFRKFLSKLVFRLDNRFYHIFLLTRFYCHLSKSEEISFIRLSLTIGEQFSNPFVVFGFLL